MGDSDIHRVGTASNDADEQPGTVPDQNDIVERTFEPGANPASEAVVYALSDAADTDPFDIDPLHESVDTDALDALIRRGERSTALSFVHADHYVSVSGAGRVVVAPEKTD
ncbi:HalOD1 output domain-containing protein [Halostella sp. PRR32]|uniref:HalOD1 output domain-containing protein n=1 Tax=Halostella sp. PRR32 TaxID=3098147 RepID=UPI002B1D7315|nr:HalOD1 output domain-containing protein [Halostella sp. PRR32]